MLQRMMNTLKNLSFRSPTSFGITYSLEIPSIRNSNTRGLRAFLQPPMAALNNDSLSLRYEKPTRECPNGHSSSSLQSVNPSKLVLCLLNARGAPRIPVYDIGRCQGFPSRAAIRHDRNRKAMGALRIGPHFLPKDFRQRAIRN